MVKAELPLVPGLFDVAFDFHEVPVGTHNLVRGRDWTHVPFLLGLIAFGVIAFVVSDFMTQALVVLVVQNE